MNITYILILLLFENSLYNIKYNLFLKFLSKNLSHNLLFLSFSENRLRIPREKDVSYPTTPFFIFP